jgi:hypothetical protein
MNVSRVTASGGTAISLTVGMSMSNQTPARRRYSA